MKKQALAARARLWWRKEIRPLLIMAVIMFSVRSSFADWNDVPSGSMKPTLVEGDRILVNKLAYDLKVPFTTWHLAEWGNPERGDIAVFYSPHDGQRLVKRVIGLPGDTVEMRNEQLFLNGEPVNYAPLDASVSAPVAEPERGASCFATEQLAARSHAVMATPSLPATRSFGPVTVPADQCFMLGDNRDNSFDSRFWGCVPRRQILGRAEAVVFSLDRTNGWRPRWERSFTALK
jgi:signal peptidase I